MHTRSPARSSILGSLLVAASFAAAAAAGAADLQVERLDLLTHGGMNQATGLFEASSRLFFDLSLAGGDKFSGLLKLSFLSGSIEEALANNGASLPPTATLADVIDRLNNGLSPQVRTVAVSAKGLFGLPVDTTYFVGYLDAFASGDEFVPLFGAAPFSTALRGPMVYPEGIGGDTTRYYEGIHEVNGTGVRLASTAQLSPTFSGFLYLYQDADVGAGSWSLDLRGLLDSHAIKLEGFTGVTLRPGAAWGVYRGGIMFYAAPGEIGQFFAQIGLPYFDPTAGFTVDNLYFLFEPRVNFGFGNLALTVFYHPLYYRQRQTAAERGALDAAMNLRFGALATDGAQGGVESLMSFRPLTSAPLTVDVSPYYALISGGIEWDFKLSLRVFPFPAQWYGIFRPFVGLKTSF